MTERSDELLDLDTAKRHLADLDPGWKIDEGPRLRRTARLPDFATALELAQRLGALAEVQNHHPELTVGWGRLVVSIWSHDVGGLTERDLRYARACDEVWPENEETKNA